MIETMEEIILINDYEDALIGYCESIKHTKVALYDKDKLIQLIMDESEMTEYEAIEYFNYNILNAYVGINSPVFATLHNEE